MGAIQVEKRWQQVCQYSGLTDADIALLHQHRDLFEASKKSVVEKFYQTLQKHPNLVKIVDDHSTFERLSGTQTWYYTSLCSPVLDMEYVKGREKIGMIHAKIGLTPDWFMSATNVYTRLFAEVVAGHEHELALNQAFVKRLLFDSSVILQQYDTVYRSTMTAISQEVKQSTAHVSEIAAQYAASAERLTHSQEAIHESMSKLVTYSHAIEKVSKIVMGVADQTHLLGLNAAIESARAGEHGRGFGVVAGEVRKLSVEVKKSSKDIQESIQRIISQVNEMSGQVATTLAVSQEQSGFAQELTALIQELEAFTHQWNDRSK